MSPIESTPFLVFTASDLRKPMLFSASLIEDGYVVRVPGGMRGPHDVAVVETKAAPLVSELK